MSLDRTPPPANIPPPLPSSSVSIEPSVCHVCKETMTEGQDCIIINQCSHTYHRQCIESHLENSSECPVCQRSFQLCELRKLNIVNKILPLAKGNPKGKGRGAVPKPYNLRSTTCNQFSESDNTNLDNLVTTDRPVRNISEANALNTPPHNEFYHSPQRNINENNVDYNKINRMIENNINRLLANLNITPPANASSNKEPNVNHSTRPNEQNHSENVINAQFLSSPNVFSISNTNNTTMHPNKITSVIQSWNLKFDGSAAGLNVDEFLYRVRSLTNDNFNGDYNVVCKNLHIMLTGKAGIGIGDTISKYKL
ncbi:putative uncharacterized protein DDB_G0282133 [Lucilia cuprina]|uniref:putative uncharacterized protein DDB_G0282133 n=1 Tax=Lucilia cuprina TaxID=7375 RepID=UPI001F066EB8|nr:putative uncharacterized protein DDB_G0282133 [Lucilia cuprina]